MKPPKRYQEYSVILKDELQSTWIMTVEAESMSEARTIAQADARRKDRVRKWRVVEVE